MENVQRNTEARKLFRKRKMVLKTLKDRGYEIPVGETNMSFGDFLQLYLSDQHHLYFPPTGEEKGGVYVYFEQSEDMNKKSLETKVGKIAREYPDLYKLFFVLKVAKSKKSVFARGTIKTDPKYAHVELLENIYPFDITRNYLVPTKHRILTEEENMQKAEQYGGLKGFPKYSVDDPIVRHYGGQPGDVFEITRGDGTYYRLVELHPK